MEKDREALKKELLEIINTKYKEYKLPQYAITDEDWEALFDIVKNSFTEHFLMDKYENALNLLTRRALYFAQVSTSNEFNISHFAHALDDLIAYGINSREINKMQQELTERTQKHTK